MAHWTITLAHEGAVIVIRGEGDDPHAPDRIAFEVRGNPGRVYRALLDRVALGPWSFLLDRMKGERDLHWIADCAYTEVPLHPGWSVETDLSPRCRRWRNSWRMRSREGKAQPGDRTDTFARSTGDHEAAHEYSLKV